MKNNNIVGMRIKEMRLEKKLTQKDLAQRLGLKNDTAIANYEAGYSTPKDDIKLKLCELFNCSIDYLLGKSDKRNNDNDKKELEINWALSGGYNALNDTNREIARSVIESLLAKQEQENKKDK